MTNLYKNLSFLVLLMALGCSSEGVKPVDPGLQRGGGNNPDADVVRPADVVIKVENPDTQPVQPDTQLKPDTLIQKEDLGIIQQPDTMVKNDTLHLNDSQTIPLDMQVQIKDTQQSVIYITPVKGDEYTYCMNPAGYTGATVTPKDLSNGKCVEIAPTLYANNQWIKYSCDEFLKGVPCNTVLVGECGYCKITCARCR